MNGDTDAALPSWNAEDLPALLTLDRIADDRFRTRFGDANRNGRSYGGQVLGQAMAAAAMTVEPQRHASVLQLVFAQGTDPARPIEFEVTPVQDGKRFSSRHVRGWQGGRIVCDANASFTVEMDSPAHADALPAGLADPDDLPEADALPDEWAHRIRRLSGYALERKPSIDFRVPDLEAQLHPDKARNRLRFWLKARQPLRRDPSTLR